MSTVQFLCPNCQQASRIDASVVGQSVTCPTCGLTVTASARLPSQPPEAEPRILNQPPTVAPLPPNPPTQPAAHFRNGPPPASQPEPPAPKSAPTLRRMSHAEKVRRRQRMNLIMLTVGLGALVVALVTLVRLTGG